jgi:hypothetical protein
MRTEEPREKAQSQHIPLKLHVKESKSNAPAQCRTVSQQEQISYVYCDVGALSTVNSFWEISRSWSIVEWVNLARIGGGQFAVVGRREAW